MMCEEQRKSDDARETPEILISRRVVLSSSSMVILSAVSGPTFAREEASGGPPKEMQERMEQSRVFSERMRNASGMEERAKIMEERNAWERARAVEQIKNELGVSDQEWSVVKPRVETVYNLLHPEPQFGGRGGPRTMTPAQQNSAQLRELLSNKEVKPEEIKAKLTALRGAKEQERQELVKARQGLRQLMTLRQEAALVLNGLLD